jgi:predicted transcriptional regulator
MTRILIDLPDDDIHWLDQIAAERGVSRAALLREAVAAYRPQAGGDWIARGAGYWAERANLPDAMAYQRSQRGHSAQPQAQKP